MRRALGIIAAGATALALLAASPASAGGKATLSVIHGIPGAAVDVCVNGNEVRSSVTYKQTFDARLRPGAYKIKVRAAEAGMCSGDVLLRARPMLRGGVAYSAVAGFAANGNPKLFLFRNDTGGTLDAKARLSVRHTAAAPKVDVYADGTKLLRWFKNGESKTFDVAPGTYRVKVNVAGTRDTAIGPKRFELRAGVAYEVYAVGNSARTYALVALAHA